VDFLIGVLEFERKMGCIEMGNDDDDCAQPTREADVPVQVVM